MRGEVREALMEGAEWRMTEMESGDRSRVAGRRVKSGSKMVGSWKEGGREENGGSVKVAKWRVEAWRALFYNTR
ncbi:hypothetical protein E2C01_035218 [Portunus trituberculatus]|uniref:Uncharacterized protein n=1 Tax=Portunus trituberculatus TaxID=210409 RepID=A0A5B7F7W5_PORTR|nr:hypothetical protein [Portunus trituberculatus]